MNFTTKPPFGTYLWAGISIFFTLYLAVSGMVLWGAVFYGVIGMSLLYWVACGKNCQITLTQDSLQIKFHRTFWKTHIVPRNQVSSLEFIPAIPFWKLFFINDSIERLDQSRDKLIIVRNDSREKILINTNRADLALLIKAGYSNI